MRWIKSALMGAAGVFLSCAASEAVASPFQDQLVQSPSLGQPQRGSIAGSLSRLAFGPSTLARGVHSLPLPVDVPGERGALLASVLPSYSAEGGISEWGVGWQADLSIRRHRVIGEIDFTPDDQFTSPWGRLVAGDDGAHYPAGLRTMVRLVQTEEGWQATTSDGTRYLFRAADGSATEQGTYSWNLSRVDTILGDSTTLTWDHNSTGRAFLTEVQWGGRLDGTQYRLSLAHEALPTPFTTFVSGSRSDLDRRVTRVTASVKVGGAYVERWRHDLAYQTSPTGPAYYLTSVTRRHASGASEPPVSYRYDFSTDQLAQATFQPAPALDGYLAAYGSGAIQPDRAAMTDIERNGLLDLETQLDQTLVRQTEAGYVFEPLPAPTGAENPLCRPAPSATNRPRHLARLHGDADEPHVVVTSQNGTGTQTRLLVCDRAGFTRLDQTVAGAWAVGANTRLADLDLDQRPDLVRVSYGSAQVLRNTSASPTELSFAPGETSLLLPRVTPVSSWVLDVNGDGRADLMVRHGGGVVVWRGVGSGRFETSGTSYLFTTASGQPLSGLSTYEFSHGDFNNDGLSDLILTKGQTVLLFTNRGRSFVQTPVAAFASIPWTVSYPVVADLSGSGNEQIVMASGGHARTLQLSRPSTGLIVSADDGKGTAVHFDYGRVRPAPGVTQLYSLLASMRVESSGHDPVTYGYDYGSPVWHSVGKYLVGFTEARKASPFLRETVAFHNDDHIAGVVTGSRDEDERDPDLVRFSERTLEPATFHGVPWLRLLSEQSGLRSADGAARLTTRTDYLAYDRGVCPTVVATAGPAGVHRQDITLAQAAGLDPELSCLTGSQRVRGAHADPSLDYDYTVSLERDSLGRLTRATQHGPDGPLVLQEVTYDALHRVDSLSTPGGGASHYAYDATGQLASVTAPDGVIEAVSARDPLTDAALESSTDRGGASWIKSASYDGLERLQSTWDNLSGTSAAQPSTRLAYTWATATSPGQILERQLLDASLGTAAEAVDLLAADGTSLGRADRQPAGWSLSRLSRSSRTALTRTTSARGPLASLQGLTHAALHAGETVLGVDTLSGAGSPLASWTTVETGVVGQRQVSRAIVGDELVETVIENGSFMTRRGLGADGRVRWSEDQDGVVTAHVRDALGRLRRLHTPGGEQRVDFDGYGRAASVERAGLQRLEWSYSPVTGQVTERRERTAAGALDRVTTYAHDAIGRGTSVVETSPATGQSRTTETHWDGVVPGAPTVPGQRGFATSVQLGGVLKSTTRTPDGRIASTRWDLDGWRTLEQSLTYLASGATRTESVTVKDGAGATLLTSTKEYTHDAHGRLASCRVDGVEIFTLSYDAEGRPAAVQFADGQLTLDHDPTTRARRGYALTGALTGSVGWHRDARGLTSEETFAIGPDAVHRTYGYDARGHLTHASDERGSASYAYDASGLISSASDERGDRPITRSGSTITAGGEGYTLDAMGRVVAHNDLTVAYGPTGDLEQAWRGADAFRFVYDEQGQRLLKFRNGSPVAAYIGGAHLDPDHLVEPVSAAGVLVGVLVDGVFERMAFDPRGTPISDDLGALSVASAYGVRAAHGSLAEAIDYVQKGLDRDLGLVRMGVRDYDPLLGQFWTPDPLLLSEIDRCAASPAECNLYGYARNNPVSFVDPTGTEADNRRTPPQVRYYEDPAAVEKLRASSGLPYTRSHGLSAGDRTLSAIDSSVTMDNLVSKWNAYNSHYEYRDFLVVNLFGQHVGRIPAADLAEIRAHLQSLNEGISSWEFTTKGGYEVRLYSATPIAGELTDASTTSSGSRQVTSGMVFKEYSEDSEGTSAKAGGTIGVKDVASVGGEASGSVASKRGKETTTSIQDLSVRAQSTTYKYSHQAQAGTVYLGVYKHGKQGVWVEIESSHEGDSTLVIQHAVAGPGSR